ncbi:hypothetical protein [Microlunatus speluncae]|uniref:hypothetical protein n=1 Tax=Microlunatus speluncae TaxID=2594267 RepID=UPI0012667AD1|nr:hypothetical protein [Microlunatus speluncae]
MTGIRGAFGTIILAIVVLTGCAAGPRACTAIGSAPGVSVTVDATAAGDVTGLELTVCWEDVCRDAEVQLSPGSDSVDQGCDSDGPDAPCSATAVPNDTLVGFANVEGLPAGPVKIRAVMIKAATEQKLPEATVMAAVTYPNGPDCGAGANQAKITIGPDGIR